MNDFSTEQFRWPFRPRLVWRGRGDSFRSPSASSPPTCLTGLSGSVSAPRRHLGHTWH